MHSERTPGSGPFARIAIVARSYQRFFLIDLALALREKHGSEVHLYVPRVQEKQFYERNAPAGLFASITLADHLQRTDRVPADIEEQRKQLFERAAAIEERSGLTINRLSMANRHFGRGFALGGYHHPRSLQSQNTSYAGVVWIYCELLDFWRREFESKNISLLIHGLAPEVSVARGLGIPFRALIEARNGKNFLWAFTEYDECPLIEDAWRNLGRSGPVTDTPGDIVPPQGHLANRALALQKRSVSRLLREVVTIAARHLYWRLRRYAKAKGYRPASEMAYALRSWRDLRRMTAPERPRLRDLQGERFVFYPLHTEPERSLQVLSQEYFFQLETIAAIARDLPAGVKLAVKEHAAAIGRRPDNFYDQILEFKNVILLHIEEHGLEVVRRAQAVVTISSTAGLEAASLGRPVISFGRHNMYNFLPHVRVVTDQSALATILREVLQGNRGGEQAERDGRRLRQALDEVSFSVGDLGETSPRGFTHADTLRALSFLERTLRVDQTRLHSVIAAD